MLSLLLLPCRKMIKDALKIILTQTEDDVISFIDQCRKDFLKLSPEEIAFPRTASDVKKYASSSDIYSKELLYISEDLSCLIIM